MENCFKKGTVVNFINTKEPNRSVGAVSMETIVNVYVPPQSENWDNVSFVEFNVINNLFTIMYIIECFFIIGSTRANIRCLKSSKE